MKKKEVKLEIKEEVLTPTEVGVGREEAFEKEPKKVLGKLDLNFNQEDVNKLKDKVNEIVDFLNN